MNKLDNYEEQVLKENIKKSLIEGFKEYADDINSAGLDYNFFINDNKKIIDEYADMYCDINSVSTLLTLLSRWDHVIPDRFKTVIKDSDKEQSNDLTDKEMIEKYINIYSAFMHYPFNKPIEEPIDKKVKRLKNEMIYPLKYTMILAEVSQSELFNRKDEKLLDTNVDLLSLSLLVYNPIIQKLKEKNIYTLRDLVSHTKEEIGNIIFECYEENSIPYDSGSYRLLCAIGYNDDAKEYYRKSVIHHNELSELVNKLGLSFAEQNELNDKTIN